MIRQVVGNIILVPLAITWLFFQYIIGPVLFIEYINKILGGKGTVFFNF